MLARRDCQLNVAFAARRNRNGLIVQPRLPPREELRAHDERRVRCRGDRVTLTRAEIINGVGLRLAALDHDGGLDEFIEPLLPVEIDRAVLGDLKPVQSVFKLLPVVGRSQHEQRADAEREDQSGGEQ